MSGLETTIVECMHQPEGHDEGSISKPGVELDGDTKHIDEIRREAGMAIRRSDPFPCMTTSGIRRFEEKTIRVSNAW